MKLSISNNVLNIVQTIGIIFTLLVTIFFAIRNEHNQSNRDSAEFMLKFSENIYSGPSKIIAQTLERDQNLDNLHISKNKLDDALDDFFNKYDSLGVVCESHLIDDKMSNESFSYDLDKALHDRKSRQFLAEALQQESDLYGTVFELAKVWGINFSPIPLTAEQ